MAFALIFALLKFVFNFSIHNQLFVEILFATTEQDFCWTQTKVGLLIFRKLEFKKFKQSYQEDVFQEGKSQLSHNNFIKIWSVNLLNVYIGKDLN